MLPAAPESRAGLNRVAEDWPTREEGPLADLSQGDHSRRKVVPTHHTLNVGDAGGGARESTVTPRLPCHDDLGQEAHPLAQPAVDRVEDGLEASGDVQLPEDAVQMALDRLLADEKDLSDLFICPA